MMNLTPSNSALLLIDVQERFQSAIPGIAADQPVGRNCRILAESAGLLGVPVLVSEQYPKGLGQTLPHLVEVLGGAERMPKTHFSCCADPAIATRIEAAHASCWVLCGIEMHVCVLATVADLLARGGQVVVAADAVSSRRPENVALGLQAARDLGALALPTETIVFRWLRQAQGDAFKRISALVR